MWRSLGRVAGVSALLGCASTERPHRIADVPVPPAADSSLVDPEEPAAPWLESPCGAATVALEFIRPNLYFAIDASGSMLDDIPRADFASRPANAGPLPSTRYANLAIAIRTLLERVGHRVNYGATLFPSSDASCDAGEEILALTPGDTVSFAVSGQSGPVLKKLMYGINRRTPRGGTPVAQALLGSLPKLTGLGTETYVFLVTDGGPNCNGALSCGADTCIPNLEHVAISETLRCSAPLNCCDGNLFGPDNCLDASGSRAAVDALAEAGIRTFVIGMPGSEVYAEVLDGLARRGGVPRAAQPSYYEVRDADELVQTVGDLGLQIALNCRIQLSQTPPDASLVNVFFDGQLIPADPDDGWLFSDADTVQIVGESCTLMQTGQVLQADIVAGCPVVLR